MGRKELLLKNTSNLKKLRKLKRLKQKDLADLSGVNVRLIQNYEQGYRNINGAPAINVYRLAQALGCNVGDILEEEKAI